MMDGLGETVKKVLLAGVGAVAITAEKSKDLLDDMVKKGELTVEQGRILNEELKHNIKTKIKENVNVSVKPSSAEELEELLTKMSSEQIQALKDQIARMERQQEDAGSACSEEAEPQEKESASEEGTDVSE